MKISNYIATTVAAGCLLVLSSVINAAEGELLFQDSLETDTSANWTVLNFPAEVTDWAVTFAFDYSTMGIPLAPNAVNGITRGLQLKSNIFTGTAQAITLVPNGQSFSGNYVMKFDLWLNYHGLTTATGPAGTGTTEYAVFGAGTDGQTVHQWAPLPSSSGVGAWFAFNGDADSTFDFRAFRNATSLVAGEGGPYAARLPENYDASLGDARNHFQPYYHTIFPGGNSAPEEQFPLFWDTTGETAPGVPGYMWNEVAVEVIDGAVRWYINDLLIADMNADTAGGEFPTDGNIFIGYADSFNSLAEHDSLLTFGLFSNVRVYGLPSEASGFAVWAIENIADENARGTMDNPSGDGISNLLKYALGLDPAVANVGALPVGVLETDGGADYLTLTVSKSSTAADVALEVEVSGNLINWESGEGNTTVILSDESNLKVRDNTPMSAADRRFIRLKASVVE